MFFMKYYKNIILRNDPLHNESEKLVKFRHQLVLQACYIDYICQSKLDEAKDMIIRPVPRELGKLMLTIVRDKSGFGRWYPKYTLVSYISNENLCTFEKEIIVGKKRSRNKLATYMISLDKKNPTAKGEALCELSFALFDDGLNPKKDKKQAWRKTLSDWTTANVFVIPIEGLFAPEGKFGDHLKVEGPELIRLVPQAVLFEDNKPTFDKDKNKYTLNFGNRAGTKSIKNTQLICSKVDIKESRRRKSIENDENEDVDLYDSIYFSLCRWDKTRFNIDIQYPMSIMNAFGIALAIFEMK